MANAPDSVFIALQSAIAGRYSLDRELGRGGMGIVYLAREVRLDRLVAIKLLPPERSPDDVVRERFLNEARLAARLSHPNIIPIHAVEDIDGFVFFVMSYIDGETLTQRVHSRGPLPASDGARVLREVAWALEYAHGQGVVHRDVKPDNILLETGSGRALVADFGIAAVARSSASEGTVTGTPEFMSPEQALGEELDARSDLYSLGATAFYMFSGRFPFEGRTAAETIARHLSESPPPVASLGRPLPRKLCLIIDRCLSKNPADRPANGQVLAEQLNAALEERRDLPAPMKEFMSVATLGGRGAAAGAIVALAASAASATLFGAAAGWVTLIVGAAAVPIASWLFAARTLISNGFDYADVTPAFNAAAAREREERGLVVRATATERALWRYAIIATPTAYALQWFLATNQPMVWKYASGWLQRLWQNYDMWSVTEVYLPIAVMSGIIAGVGALTLTKGRRDLDSAFWARVWTGRVGRSLFDVAQQMVGAGSRRVAVTHRATELSLGLAAEELFANLPSATRAALTDMPLALKRLQNGAHVLRGEIDRLQDALNEAGAVAMSEDYSAVRATRDDLVARHREAIAELERLRLGLLRLHAGAVSLESVTTHLKLATAVSEHVERLIKARSEVERDLAYPRPPIPSPA